MVVDADKCGGYCRCGVTKRTLCSKILWISMKTYAGNEDGTAS